ncbi:MAG: tail fiber domain-containing protein [Flavobacteriaceae bacterium]|nr:tail fiber domain-containing protein [Flavobacteriaceae bacterium]
MGNTAITDADIQVAWTVTSDKRWKEQIRDLPYGLEFVKQLKPVDYIRKNNDRKTREMGFIAQDMEALLAKVGYDDQGFLKKNDKGYISLRYNDLIALLTKAIQEQQEIIEDQNTKYEKLLKRVEQLELASNK